MAEPPRLDLVRVVCERGEKVYSFVYALDSVVGRPIGLDWAAEVIVNQFAKMLAENILGTPVRSYSPRPTRDEILAEYERRKSEVANYGGE